MYECVPGYSFGLHFSVCLCNKKFCLWLSIYMYMYITVCTRDCQKSMNDCRYLWQRVHVCVHAAGLCVFVCVGVRTCVFVWVSSVRFRQCLSVGIVGLTALSRHKVLYSAENGFPCWKKLPPSDWLSRPDRKPHDLGKNFKTPRREILATFCTE